MGDGYTATGALSVTGWQTIDVSNEGYDGSGDKDLSEVVTEYGGDTIYVLPSGTYTLGGDISLREDFGVVGFIGRPHATIDVVSNDSEHVFKLGGGGTDSKRTLIENITVDITGVDEDGRDVDRGLLDAVLSENLRVRNLSLVGQRHRHQSDGDGTYTTVGSRYTVRVLMTRPSASAHVSGLRMPDGEVHEPEKDEVGHAIGVSEEPPCVGTTVYENCYVEGFIDNGFYVAGSSGPTTIRNTTVKNCGNTNIRLSANDRVSNCRIVLDNASEREYSSTGLWCDGAHNATVSGLDIDASDTNGDIVRTTDELHGCRIENVHIDCASSQHCRIDGGGEGQIVTLANWCVEDSANGHVRNEFLQVNAPHVRVRDSSIETENRYPITVDGEDCTIDGCVITVPDSNRRILGAVTPAFENTVFPNGVRLDGNTTVSTN